MIEHRQLREGERVRILAPSHLLTLRSSTGHIVRPDAWDGYYIVRLDQPAIYHHADGSTEDLREVREAADNMEVLSY